MSFKFEEKHFREIADQLQAELEIKEDHARLTVESSENARYISRITYLAFSLLKAAKMPDMLSWKYIPKFLILINPEIW